MRGTTISPDEDERKDTSINPDIEPDFHRHSTPEELENLFNAPSAGDNDLTDRHPDRNRDDPSDNLREQEETPLDGKGASPLNDSEQSQLDEMEKGLSEGGDDADPETPFSFKDDDAVANDKAKAKGKLGQLAAKRDKLKERARKKLKKRLIIGGGAGGFMIVLILILIFLASSLKLPHFIANIEAYEFERLSRNFADSVSEVTEEKLAVDSADTTFLQSLGAKYQDLRSSTWGKLDKFRPQKVLDNMQSDGQLEYLFKDEPRTFKLPGMSDTKQVLNGVKIDGNEITFGDSKWYDYFGKRTDRLEFAGKLQAQLESALDDSATLIRGSVAGKIRDELGIKLRRWERLTKAYRNAKEAEAAQIKETYDDTKTKPSDTAAVNDIADAEQGARDIADKCVGNEACLESLTTKEGEAALKKEISQRIATAINESALQKGLGIVSKVYGIALPACMIYESSVTSSGPTVDANSDRAVKTYYTVASAASQQQNGGADASQIGGLNDELGDVSNTPSELRASNKDPGTQNFSNPQASQAMSYTIADALFGGIAGKIFDDVMKPSCPIITDPYVGAGLAAAEFAAKAALAVGTAGSGDAVVEGGEDTMEITVKQILQQMVSETFNKAALKDLVKTGVRDSILILGGSLLAKIIVIARMGNMSTPVPLADDLGVQTDEGANVHANDLCRQQLYCRPMSTPEVVASNFQDSKDIAFQNSQKSVFERYLSPSNPTSMLSNTAISLSSSFQNSITTFMQGLISKIGSVFQPNNGLLAMLFSGDQKKAMAATTDTHYNIVQWGWTPEEEALIEANPNHYSPINNAETMERSGELPNLKAKYDKCFTEDMGKLLADGDIKRDKEGAIDPDNGACAPNKLGPKNQEAFDYRIYMRNQATLDQLDGIQNPTVGAAASSSSTGATGSDTTTLTAPGLNGYAIPCQGIPGSTPKKGARDDSLDWSGIKDSGTIGTNSGGQPMKVYIREACDTTNVKTVVIASSIHASENQGQEISFDMLFNKTLPSNLRVIAIPEVNGYSIDPSAPNSGPNAQGGSNIPRVNKNGVNLNRNFNFNWVPEGAGDPLICENGECKHAHNWSGPSADSEPETKAVEQFLLSLGKTSLLIAYHDNLGYAAASGEAGKPAVHAYHDYLVSKGITTIDDKGGTCNCDLVPQHGALDAWYASKTNTPTFLVEMNSATSSTNLGIHADAIINLFKTGVL